MPARRISGALTWILGLLTLITVLTTFDALIQLNLYGNAATTYLNVFNVTLGSLNVKDYFWMSLIAMFLLFTATCFSIYRGLPLEPQLMQRIAKLEENLAANSNMLENTQIGFFKKLEDAEKQNDDMFRRISLNLEETRKEVAYNLDNQVGALRTIKRRTRKSAEDLQRQTTELTSIRKTIDQLNNQHEEKPKLTGQTKIEDFRSITPNLAAKLNGTGITNVSQLLAADSYSVAEKTREPPETIARLQAQAQLLLVPTVDEKHSELLVRFGVTSRRELASQDPVQLYRGVTGIAKTYVEQGKMPANKAPTIEDVSSWIQQARL